MSKADSFEPALDGLDSDLLPQPEFQSRAEMELFEVARFGVDMRDFLRTPVGVYLKGCAVQEIRAVQAELLTVSPWRRRKIQQLQLRAQAARNVLSWLNEALQMGEQAYQALQQNRSED